MRGIRATAGAVVALALIWCMKSATTAAETTVDPAALAELHQIGADMEKQFARLEARLRAAPRDTFDPQALHETIGRDPAGLMAWVRDKTDLFPYRGALRGSRGVVMDRGGNSLDRSLLLAELLSATGYEVRLANATLSTDQANSLLGKIASVRVNYPKRDDVEARISESRQRVNKHAAQLIAALGPDAAAPVDASLAEKLADHWWVQHKDAAGKWIDADACGVDPLPAPARTVAYKGDGKLPLESKDYHAVVLRLMIEAYKDKQLKSELVLEQTLRPAEIFDRSMMLYHYSDAEVVGEGSENASDEAKTKKLKDAIIAETDYMPVLVIGGEPTASYSFDTSGEVNKNPEVDKAGKMGGGAAAKFGAFGGALAGGSDAANEKPDLLTAEWIEYEIHVPGEAKPQIVRRMVFDLIGPAARAAGLGKPPEFTNNDKLRRGLMLMGTSQTALQPCDIPGGFIADQMIRAQLHDRDIWRSLTRAEFKSAHDVAMKLSRTKAVPDFPMLVAMSRFPIGPTAATTFIDRPNIVQFRSWGERESDGTIVFPQGIDLAFTSTAAMPGATAREAFVARLTQGIADTVAENLGASQDSPRPENTVPLFEMASVAPLVARKPEDLSSLGLPPDVASRAGADLAAGNILVIAKVDSGRSGWWKVDSATGQTVGVMDNGYHSTAEYKLTKGRPPPGPERARYLQQMMRNNNSSLRFKDLDRAGYEKICQGSVPEAEWAEVLSLQGRAPAKALSIAEQLLKGRIIKP